jgi:Asp/Glu/hydantoin racemase
MTARSLPRHSCAGPCGGLNNASTYIGLVAGKRLGIVILVNRGEQYPHETARERILPALAR